MATKNKKYRFKELTDFELMEMMGDEISYDEETRQQAFLELAYRSHEEQRDDSFKQSPKP